MESRSRHVLLPSEGLAALRRAIRTEAGPLAAIHALHQAGYESGGVLFDAFTADLDEELSGISDGMFWSQMSRFLARRGWGAVSHDDAHPGVGLLRSRDWAEATPDGSETQPTCAFSSGMLSHFLTRAAGGPVAVLEVSCRSRGDDACAFAFGSEAAIHRLYGSLLEGRDLQGAFQAL